MELEKSMSNQVSIGRFTVQDGEGWTGAEAI